MEESCAAMRWRAVYVSRENVITRPSEPPVARMVGESWSWQTKAEWP